MIGKARKNEPSPPPRSALTDATADGTDSRAADLVKRRASVSAPRSARFTTGESSTTRDAIVGSLELLQTKHRPVSGSKRHGNGPL